jgi:hypothetical protein
VTRGTEIPLLAGKRSKIFVVALLVSTLDPGHSQGVVATLQEFIHTVGDSIEAELTVISGIAFFVRQGEIVDVFSQNDL